MYLTRFIKDVTKTEIENIFAVVAALLVLLTTMVDPYMSVSIAVTLLVALGTYTFVTGPRQWNTHSSD